MSYETADILDGAADVIERDGWHQGDYGAPGKQDQQPIEGQPVCALGAIRVARRLDVRWSAAAAAWFGGIDDHPAVEALAQTTGIKVGGVHKWNDAPERTKQEVLDALRLAAKNERCAADGITS